MEKQEKTVEADLLVMATASLQEEVDAELSKEDPDVMRIDPSVCTVSTSLASSFLENLKRINGEKNE